MDSGHRLVEPNIVKDMLPLWELGRMSIFSVVVILLLENNVNI